MGIQGLLPALKPYACNRNVSNNVEQQPQQHVLRATSTTPKPNNTKNSNNIRQFHGQNVAVDASSWLHKSVYSIADLYVETVVERNGAFFNTTTTNNRTTTGTNGYKESYNKCVSISANYMYQRCYELHTYAGLPKIYLVLDGQQRCPLKQGTNQERERKRQVSLQQARHLYRTNRNNKSLYYEKYKTCIKITYEFTKDVVEKLQNKILQSTKSSSSSSSTDNNNTFAEIVWSPYEADAQLVQCVIDQRVSFIITEDSDVLVYCIASNTNFPIVYKLDRNNGTCDVWSMDWLIGSSSTQQQLIIHSNNAAKTTKKTKNKNATESGQLLPTLLRTIQTHEKNTPGLGRRLFVQACILSGCDYTPTNHPLLNGIGFLTALKLVCSCNGTMTAIDESIVRIVQRLRNKQLLKPIVNNNTYNSTIRATKNNTSNKNDEEDDDKNDNDDQKDVSSDLIERLIDTLLKCEAVFYYHPVRNVHNTIIYLNGTPNSTIATTTSSTTTLDYRPSLGRYEPETWSLFLGTTVILQQDGETTKNKSSVRNVTKPPSVLDQLKNQHVEQQHRQAHQPKQYQKYDDSFQKSSFTSSRNTNNHKIDQHGIPQQQQKETTTTNVLSDITNRHAEGRINRNPYNNKKQVLSTATPGSSMVFGENHSNMFSLFRHDKNQPQPHHENRRIATCSTFGLNTTTTTSCRKRNVDELGTINDDDSDKNTKQQHLPTDENGDFDQYNNNDVGSVVVDRPFSIGINTLTATKISSDSGRMPMETSENCLPESQRVLIPEQVVQNKNDIPVFLWKSRNGNNNNCSQNLLDDDECKVNYKKNNTSSTCSFYGDSNKSTNNVMDHPHSTLLESDISSPESIADAVPKPKDWNIVTTKQRHPCHLKTLTRSTEIARNNMNTNLISATTPAQNEQYRSSQQLHRAGSSSSSSFDVGTTRTTSKHFARRVTFDVVPPQQPLLCSNLLNDDTYSSRKTKDSNSSEMTTSTRPIIATPIVFKLHSNDTTRNEDDGNSRSDDDIIESSPEQSTYNSSECRFKFGIPKKTNNDPTMIVDNDDVARGHTDDDGYGTQHHDAPTCTANTHTDKTSFQNDPKRKHDPNPFLDDPEIPTLRPLQFSFYNSPTNFVNEQHHQETVDLTHDDDDDDDDDAAATTLEDDMKGMHVLSSRDGRPRLTQSFPIIRSSSSNTKCIQDRSFIGPAKTIIRYRSGGDEPCTKHGVVLKKKRQPNHRPQQQQQQFSIQEAFQRQTAAKNNSSGKK